MLFQRKMCLCTAFRRSISPLALVMFRSALHVCIFSDGKRNEGMMGEKLVKMMQAKIATDGGGGRCRNERTLNVVASSMLALMFLHHPRALAGRARLLVSNSFFNLNIFACDGTRGRIFLRGRQNNHFRNECATRSRKSPFQIQFQFRSISLPEYSHCSCFMCASTLDT